MLIACSCAHHVYVLSIFLFLWLWKGGELDKLQPYVSESTSDPDVILCDETSGFVHGERLYPAVTLDDAIGRRCRATRLLSYAVGRSLVDAVWLK